MFSDQDLIEMYDKEKKRKLKRIENQKNYIKSKYNNFNKKPKAFNQLIKNKNFVGLSDNIINQINKNLKISDNLTKRNRKLSHMFYKTPYFATREIEMSNKLQKFFQLYSNGRIEPKINLKKKEENIKQKHYLEQKRQNNLIERLLRNQHDNYQKKLDGIEKKLSELLLKEENKKRYHRRKTSSKKLSPIKNRITSINSSNSKNYFKQRQYEINKKNKYKKIFKKEEEGIYIKKEKPLFFDEENSERMIYNPESESKIYNPESESLIYNPEEIKVSQKEKTEFFLNLELGSLENIKNLHSLKNMDTKYSKVVNKTPTSSFNNDILTFSTHNSLVTNFRKSMFKMKFNKKPNGEVEQKKKKGVKDKNKIKRSKKELQKILRKTLIVVRFIMRTRFFIKLKRISKIENFKSDYSTISKNLSKYFINSLKKDILMKIWTDKKNFFFISNKKVIWNLAKSYKLKFKENKDKNILKEIANLINNFFKLLLNENLLNSLKLSFNNLFVGKQCVFPQTFFYKFEHDFFKTSYFGFFEILDKKKSIFLIFSLIIVKYFLKIVSDPKKHISNFDDFPKKKNIILINTLIFCSIFETIFFDTIKKNFRFTKIPKESVLESVKIIEKQKFKIIENFTKPEEDENQIENKDIDEEEVEKKVRIVVPEKKKTKYNIFYDSIDKKKLKIFFENTECVHIYENTLKEVINKFENLF